MSIWINKTNYLVTKNTPYSATGKHWVNDDIVPALLVYQRVRAERGVGVWMVHSCKNCTSLGMPYKCNILTSKQKHSFSEVFFVCKHQVVVWRTVLSEHFEALHTGKDGLRWVTFFAENVGQLISYYYIAGKLEHIYPEKQQGDSEKDNGPKHMDGDDARWRNARQNKHCALNELAKHSHSLSNISDKL